MATDSELGGLSWDVWGLYILPQLHVHDLCTTYALFYVLLKDVDAYYFADANIPIPKLSAKVSIASFFETYRAAISNTSNSRANVSTAWSLARRRRLTILLSFIYKALELLQNPTQMNNIRTILPYFYNTYTFKLHTTYYLRPYYAFIEKFAWALPMTTAHFAMHDARTYNRTHTFSILQRHTSLAVQHLGIWLAWLWRHRQTFGLGTHCTAVHIGLHANAWSDAIERVFAMLQYLPKTVRHLNLWKSGSEIAEGVRSAQTDHSTEFMLAQAVRRLKHLTTLELDFSQNFSITANISACLNVLPPTLTTLKLHDSWIATTEPLFGNLPPGLTQLQLCVDPQMFSCIEFAQLHHTALQSLELRGRWNENCKYNATLLSQLCTHMPMLHTLALVPTRLNDRQRWDASYSESTSSTPNSDVTFWTANAERVHTAHMCAPVVFDDFIYKNMSGAQLVNVPCTIAVPFSFLRSSITRLALHDLDFALTPRLPERVNLFWWPTTLQHLDISFSNMLRHEVPFTAIWPLPSDLKTLCTRNVSWCPFSQFVFALPATLESLHVETNEPFTVLLQLILPPNLTRCTIPVPILPCTREFVRALPRTLTHLNVRFESSCSTYSHEDALKYLPTALKTLELHDLRLYDSGLRWLPATVQTVRITVSYIETMYPTRMTLPASEVARYIPSTVQTLIVNQRVVAVPSFMQSMQKRCKYTVRRVFMNLVCTLYEDSTSIYHFVRDVTSYILGNRDATTMHHDVISMVDSLSDLSWNDIFPFAMVVGSVGIISFILQWMHLVDGILLYISSFILSIFLCMHIVS